MEKGLTLLRSMGGQAPEWKLRPKEHSLHKLGQATNWYHWRKSEAAQGASPEARSFESEAEDLRRMFLRRPDCPQFCSRATSVSNYGSASTVALPGVACPGPEAWKTPKDSPSSQQGLDEKVDGPLPPVSKSACEFNHLRKKSESPTLSPATSSLVLGQSHLRKRIPWYISVIHEKDRCLSTLGAEVRRLSELEAQVQRKDEEIAALQEEREALRKQLRDLRRGRVSEAPAGQGTKERPSESPMKPLDRQSFLQTCVRDEEELHHWRQMQEEYVMGHRARDLEAVGEEEQGLEGAVEREAEEGAKKEAECEEGGEEEEEEEGQEEVELELDEEQEVEGRAGGRRMACLRDEDFEEELMAQLQEYEQVIQEFQFELEIARTRLSLATGACISLQRQVDHQEAHLQKANTENQLLQKELRERKCQLQAMTDKFSSLREEKKWEEVKGLVEKDNFLLRQKVSELERELLNGERALAESEAKVSQLQAQVTQSQKQQQTWHQLQEVMRDKVEAVQQAEQQARVALESAQSRLERLRNKIIQATFGASGAKSVTTEISDSDILEALQRLVSERAEYYSQLKQRGFKGPGPPQSELSSQGKSKKLAASK